MVDIGGVILFGVDLGEDFLTADDVVVFCLVGAGVGFVLGAFFLVVVLTAAALVVRVVATMTVDEAIRAGGGCSSVTGAGASTVAELTDTTFGGSSSIVSAFIGGSGAASMVMIGGVSWVVLVGVSAFGVVGALGGEV